MKMDMDRLLKKEPDLFSVRNEVKDVSDVYLEKYVFIIFYLCNFFFFLI